MYSSVNHPSCIILEVVYDFAANNAWILVNLGIFNSVYECVSYQHIKAMFPYFSILLY